MILKERVTLAGNLAWFLMQRIEAMRKRLQAASDTQDPNQARSPLIADLLEQVANLSVLAETLRDGAASRTPRPETKDWLRRHNSVVVDRALANVSMRHNLATRILSGLDRAIGEVFEETPCDTDDWAKITAVAQECAIKHPDEIEFLFRAALGARDAQRYIHPLGAVLHNYKIWQHDWISLGLAEHLDTVTHAHMVEGIRQREQTSPIALHQPPNTISAKDLLRAWDNKREEKAMTPSQRRVAAMRAKREAKESARKEKNKKAHLKLVPTVGDN